MSWLLVLLLWASASLAGERVMFEERFDGKLSEGWHWIRENPRAWRIGVNALEVLVEPGNMWGPPNNAKNVLVRSVPIPATGTLEISVTASNKPSEQYEQVDLVWYYDDSHMVKIGQEQVDGKLCIVMGREEKDRTRTIAIIPLESFTVSLRYLVSSNHLRGEFQIPGEKNWRLAGQCDLPAPGKSKPRVSLQFYQGPAQVEHWARITDFVIRHND